jgi:hypothetical protein
MRGKLRTFSVAAAGALALLIAAFAGTAVAKDRNHDQIPDKWEKRYHLSLKVDQANKDQDRDAVGNLDEYQEGTSPRDSDSDNDGVLDGDDEQEGVDDQGDDEGANEPDDQGDDNDEVEDGDENDDNAGVIASFDEGVLTINLDGGGQVSGAVDSNTEIECETVDESEVGDDSGPDLESASDEIDDPGDEETGSGEEEPGDDGTPGGDDVEEPDENACTVDDLTPGTVVHEAELEGGTFSEVELVK